MILEDEVANTCQELFLYKSKNQEKKFNRFFKTLIVGKIHKQIEQEKNLILILNISEDLSGYHRIFNCICN